jgi:fructose transport system ATP-binding protein
VSFKEPLDARNAGIETVYQTLAVAPALDIASNLYLGRELRRKDVLGKVFRLLDTPAMRRQAADEIKSLGIQTLQDITQAVETLSGGQRQAVAVARAAAFGTKVVILDEPTAALGVRETGQVIELIKRLRDHGLPIILIAHDIPMIFQLADRIQVQRLARRVAVIKPETHSMEDAVAIMTGARAA